MDQYICQQITKFNIPLYSSTKVTYVNVVFRYVYCLLALVSYFQGGCIPQYHNLRIYFQVVQQP